MNTNEENVKALVKLGIDVKDIANIYLNITQKGQDISKQDYLNNLTEMIKFFQARNLGLNGNEQDAIYKEDVLEMIQKNRKLISLSVDKKVKDICEKLDGYYFMNPSYTNKVIKKNPNLFSVNKIDLEVFATIFSEFAIKVDEKTVNSYEYIVKHYNQLLNEDVQTIYQRLMYIYSVRKSKLLTTLDLENLMSKQFNYDDKDIKDEELKEKYKLPAYAGNIEKYKEEILEKLK